MPAVTLKGVPCWILPALAGLIWLLTLTYLIVMWAANGSNRYLEMYATQPWPYISNTGATAQGKPVFIAGGILMVVLFNCAIGLERYLRHRGMLVHVKNRGFNFVYATSTFFTAAGSAALVLLTIFDIRRQPEIHYPLVTAFLFAYLIAACLVCAERYYISIHFHTNTILRLSFHFKFLFVITEIILACIFGGTALSGFYRLSVVTEWLACLLLTFYIWTYTLDFLATSPQRSSATSLLIKQWDEEGMIATPQLARHFEPYVKVCHSTVSRRPYIFWLTTINALSQTRHQLRPRSLYSTALERRSHFAHGGIISKSTSLDTCLNSTLNSLDQDVTYLIGVAIFNGKSSCAALTENSAPRLLVLKRSATDDAFPGMWAVPGGHVESNETVTQAIERETYEETGLRANHVVGEFATLFWEGSSGRRCAQLNFTVTVEQSEPIQLSSEEHSEWKWVTESELLKLPCSEGMASVFTNAFREADAMASEAPTILKE